MGKVFPISKGVACQLKWTWNTLRLAEATSASCHRVVPIPLTVDNFENFHNDPTWVSHRRMQLDGRFPQQGCQYCEKIESAGGISDRLLHNNAEDLYPPELDSDPGAVEVTPRVLEIFINNACNLACIYCDESNSSRIQKENKKFGHSVVGITSDPSVKNMIPIVPKSDNFADLLEKFFGYLDKNYHQLKRLHVLGGEPFYQKEFFRLIDYVSNNKNPDLKLNIVTNLMVSKNVLEKFIDTAKQALSERRLARVDVTASIDCWGDEQEYTRFGLDLQQWQENFEYLLSHKWLYVGINSTITSLTIKTLPDLLKYINQLRESHRINHSFGLVDGNPQLHPGIMGQDYWQQDFGKILAEMPRNHRHDELSYDYMSGIAKTINSSQEDLQKQIHLRHYLDEIDRRRCLDWRNVFPWLADKLDQINVV